MIKFYLFLILAGIAIFFYWVEYNMIKRHLPDGMTFIEYAIIGDKVRYVK